MKPTAKNRRKSAGGGIGQDSLDDSVENTQEIESALTYETVFERVKELAHVENPKSLARSAVWRRCYDLVRNGMATYEELFHEAVVGMYMAVESGEQVEKIEVFRSVGRNLEAYKCFVISRRHSIPFSQLENKDDGEIAGEEMAERLRFKIKLEQVEDDTGEAIQEDDFITDLMRQAKEVIIESGEAVRDGQGKRDWDLFTRYLTGDRLEDLCVSCPWLTSVDSVEKALQRIILKLRQNIDGAAGTSTTVNLIAEGRTNKTRENEEERFDQQAYYAKWYEDHKEARRAQMREYAREKRAREKGLRSEETGSDGES